MRALNEKNQTRIYEPDSRTSLINGAKHLLVSCRRNRALLFQMIRRDVLLRYKGSLFGLLWSFINPIVLLATYSFVFSLFFKMQATLPDGEPYPFFIALFCGLIPFQFFSEVMSRSPSLILGSPNFVKRIAFPLELIPLSAVGSALFHAGVTMGLLLLAIQVFMGGLPLTALWLPLVWLPLIIFTYGLALFMAAAGVFARDLVHSVGLALNILFFLTPIVYMETMIPKPFQWILFVNPVAYAVSNLRKTCVYGESILLGSWALFLLCSVLVVFLVGGWFQAIRKRFADVM